MGTMTEWAEREVEIAKNRENPNRKPGQWDYGCACYESALKAYKSLMSDNHSGMSFGFTRDILKRLLDELPLTPIEDTDDIWDKEMAWTDENGVVHYQCLRRPSLFKGVYPDGHVEYRDNQLCVCVNINGDSCYHSGLVSNVISEMFPIEMPYFPGKPMTVFCTDFLTHEENGDFDTIGILYIRKSDGTTIDVFRYFKWDQSDTQWVEIDEEEFDKRYDEAFPEEDVNEG